jgi:predicted GIY-YIG superfamily endonuclease
VRKKKAAERTNAVEVQKGLAEGCWLVYLLRCADGTLYTGITNNLERRLEKHNAGTASRYTRSRLPVELVYQEVQATRSLALKRELAIKALSRRAKQSLIGSASKAKRRATTK